MPKTVYNVYQNSKDKSKVMLFKRIRASRAERPPNTKRVDILKPFFLQNFFNYLILIVLMNIAKKKDWLHTLAKA